MILQDLAGILLSSLSFFARDFFRLAWRHYKELRTPSEDETQSNLLTASLRSDSHSYGAIPFQDVSSRPNLLKSFFSSLWTSVTMLIATLPLGVFATLLLFAELNFNSLCSEWMVEHKHFKDEGTVLRWKLVGNIIEDLGLFFWFPATMIFLFGWKEFKTNYLVILLICFSCGCVEIIYKLLLFVFNPYVAKEFYYRTMGNVCFFTSILWSSYLIANKIHKNGNFSVPPPKILIMAAVCAQFIFAFIIGLTASYFILPTFTELDSQFMKAVFAAITPVVTVLPVAVCRQFALLSNVFTNSKNQFILAYFVYGATVIVYRVMQADVDSTWLFIGLSVTHGLVNVVGKATERLRYKLWAQIFRALKKLKCCRRMELQHHDSPYHVRLNADKEIQTMLYDYTAMILSQMYLILYLITNYDHSPDNNSWEVSQKYLIRIAIGLGIDIFFNTFSILVRSYMYNNPVEKVWKEYWRVHMIANVVTTAMTVWYFGNTLLAVVRDHEKTPTGYVIKNCTAPIHY